MKLKFFCKSFLGLILLLFYSCEQEKVEYRNVNENEEYHSFIIKTKKDIKKWGIVSQGGESLPCEYDSLCSAPLKDFDFETMILGWKDGKKYAWSIGGWPFFNGRNFNKIVPRKQATNNDALICNYHEAHFSDGIVFFHLHGDHFEFGPAQYLFGAEKSLIYKKNGKWGIKYESDMKDVAPCIYDGAIEINGGHGPYWIVKKNGKWSAIDREGKAIDKSAYIPKMLQLPIIESYRIADDPFGRPQGTYQRTGGENYGYIRYFSGIGREDY